MDSLVENNNHINFNNDSQVVKTTPKKGYDKETTREYNKMFFQKNKDKKYHCDLCNCDVSFFNSAHHKASKKHIALLEKNKYIQILEEKDTYIKHLEEKQEYSKLLEEKEQYEKLLKEKEQQIMEYKQKYNDSSN